MVWNRRPTRITTFTHLIHKACCKEPEERTLEEVNQIAKFVKDSSHAFDNLDELQQKAICEAMSIEEFNMGDVVFDYGEVGEKFYIVLEGHLQILVPQGPCPTGVHAAVCNCEDRQWDLAVKVERGGTFGELALLSDQPRSARVVATQRSELLVMKRSTYNQYVGEQHGRFIKERVGFLRQCKCFEDALKQGIVTLKDIGSMAQCLRERRIQGETVICRQGGDAENIVFVRSGRLLKLRVVDECRTERGSISTRSSSSSPQKSLSSRSAVQGGAALSPDGQAESIMEMKKRERSKMKEHLASNERTPRRPSPMLPPKDSLKSAGEEPSKPALGPRRSCASPRRSQGGSCGGVQVQPSAKKHLLCVGKLDPYEYMGHQFLVNDQAWPVSLVSDVVANVYLLSKHDVLRRVSNKVFQAIFSTDGLEDALPSDRQLLEMNRQTERWEAYRKVAHLEAGPRRPEPTRQPDASSPSASPRRSRASARLTLKEMEHFSEADVETMRRISSLQNDKGLQNALRRSGRTTRAAELGDFMDPNEYRLEQHWQRVSKEDHNMLALDDALDQVKDATLRISGPASVTADIVAAPTNSARGGLARRSSRLPMLVRSGAAAPEAGAREPAAREQVPLVLPCVG